MHQLNHWIDGQSTAPESGETFDLLAPLDDTRIAVAARGSAGDVERAVTSAQAAFASYRATAPSDREAWLLRAAELLQQRSEPLCESLIDEVGSPITKARREITTSIGVLRAAAGAVRRVTGDTLPTDTPDRLSLSLRRPLGVVAGITPFNVPLIKSVKQTAMALATGNTVVLMPSPEAPTVAVELAKIYTDAGMPPGVCNVLLGRGEEIGDALTSDRRVRLIGFTGSTRTGRHIAEIAGRLGKRVTLEMGGKNPLVILDDANLAKAIPAAVLGGFLFQGQICMSSSRIYVQHSHFDAVAEKLVAAAEKLPAGDLREEATVVGPIINAKQRARVRRHIEDAVDRGATVLCGGGWDGNRCRPTLLAGIDDSMLVGGEETFGPVITLEGIDDLDDAITRCNATPFGLTASIFTADLSAALRFAEEVHAGMVHINGATVQEEPQVPFGGVGDSGFGREGALVGIDELTEWKWITLGPG